MATRYRKSHIFKNTVPIYDYVVAGSDNPFKWIWFPQYKVGSRTIETNINKTLCELHWRKNEKPEVGYTRFTNVPLSTDRLEFMCDKNSHAEFRADDWSPDNPRCLTSKVFDEQDSPDNYYKFMFVRNPWDRAVSCWADRRYNRGKIPNSRESTYTFEEYVDSIKNSDMFNYGNPHVRLQYSMVAGVNFDHVGRLENFQEDWKKICDHFSVEPFKKEFHQNKTERTHYRDYYNAKTKDIIKNLYKLDIEQYGYTY